MVTKCCRNCVYATQAEGHWHRVMMRRFPGLRLCFNHPETPGRMREIRVDGMCENFRAQRWPNGKRCTPPKPPNDEIRYIPLTHGLYATVDAEDYEKLSQYKWHAQCDEGRRTVYAARNTSYREHGRRHNRIVLMHREIMKTPKGMVVDHINGNGANNRRCNMRNCTQFQNTHNNRPRKDGKSRFIGVDPHRDKWRARVCYKGRKHHIGLFTDEVEAARARDRKAVELFGEFARLNFPRS
jgi:HNH endonuclease